MRRMSTLAISCLTVLTACSGTPERIAELEAARTAVSEVEASPDAGVAAVYVSDARQALGRADRLARRGSDIENIQHQARVALRNAQIAAHKILTKQARDVIDEAQVARQAVLLETREKEARRAARRAERAEERLEALRDELGDVEVQSTDRGFIVRLEDVLFATDKAILQPGAYRMLNRVAEALKMDPTRRVLIEGHTDSVGSAEYNQALSARRAAAVQAALLMRGVPLSQMTAIGLGESTPIAGNSNAGGRQENRRVELIFQHQPQVAAEGG